MRQTTRSWVAALTAVVVGLLVFWATAALLYPIAAERGLYLLVATAFATLTARTVRRYVWLMTLRLPQARR